MHHSVLYRLLLAGVLLCTIARLASAQKQPVRFEHYTTKQGLSSNVIFEITEDSKGYIWASSPAGLNRFDGKKIQVFTHDEKDSLSLPLDRSRVFADKQGLIWSWSEKGLHYFNDTTDHFIRIPFNHNNHAVSAIGDDNEGNLWVTTENGNLYQVSKRQKKATLATTLAVLVNHIFCDSKNRLWLVGDEGIFLYNAATKKTTAFADKKVNAFFSMFEDQQQQLWLSSWGDGIKHFNPETGIFTNYHFNNTTTESVVNYAGRIIQPSSRHELWITSIDPNIGIAVFNTDSKTFSYINHKEGDDGSLASNASICIFQAKSGIVWYACEKGIDKYDPLANRFAAINLADIPGCRADAGIADLYFHKNELWIGATEDGLFILDSTGTRLIKTVNLSAVNHVTESNIVNCIKPLVNEQFFICSYKGAFIYNHTSGKITELPLYRETYVADMLYHPQQQLYMVATKSGVVRHKSLTDAPIDTILSNWSIHKIYQLGNTVWLGSAQGLFDYNNGNPVRVEGSGEAFKRLSESRVHDITTDDNDNLILATSSGVMLYNPQKKALQTFSKQDGLRHNNCSHILQDKQHKTIWVTHEQGIASIHLATRKIVNYGNAEGLSSPTFVNTPIAQKSNGDIYFGRYMSVYSFTPGNIAANSYHAPIYISKVLMGDSLLAKVNWLQQQPLQLNYHQNDISFEYAMLNFSNVDGDVYEYMLEGSNNNHWTAAEGRNFVTYSELPPANYTFKVRGKNSDGISSANEASLSFTIVPPYWQTYWFKTLMATLLLSLVGALVWLRIRNLKAKAAVKQQMLEAEVKALRAQMNPHFIFNCMNTIDSFILQNKQLQASLLVQRFSKLTRRVLEHTQHAYITIEEEMETLKTYLMIERLRQSDSFEFSIDIEPSATSMLVPPMLIQPFVENAVIHGIRSRKEAGGHISIRVMQQIDFIKIIVEDNGVGREKAMQIKAAQPAAHRSISMELTLSRLEALHGHKNHEKYLQFIDLKNEQTGTRVEITIPQINV